jgi:hypothetical protein
MTAENASTIARQPTLNLIAFVMDRVRVAHVQLRLPVKKYKLSRLILFFCGCCTSTLNPSPIRAETVP